jgi:multidrug resistance efflux pump
MNKTREVKHSSPGNGAAPLSERVRSLRLPVEGGGGRRRPAILPWVVCAILLFTTTAFGYRAYRVGMLTPASIDAPRQDHDATSVAPTGPAPVAASGEVVLQAKGYVVPAHQVQVSPKVGGMIVWLNPDFEEGRFFKKDTILARLETDDYEHDRDRAEEAHAAAVDRWLELVNGSRPQEIEQARYELKESEATLRQLKLDMDRSGRLARTDSMAQRDWEQARFGYEAMERRVRRLKFALDLMQEGPRKERINAAHGDVHAALADLHKAQWKLDNCEIRAPIDGHVLTKKAEKGNLVNPLAFTISGSLCDMANLGDLEIDLAVQERDIARVERDQPCTVMPEAYQNHEPFRKRHPQGYTARVARLMPIADRAKGAISVRVKVEIPADEVGRYLKPDMSVLVSFQKVSSEAHE